MPPALPGSGLVSDVAGFSDPGFHAGTPSYGKVMDVTDPGTAVWFTRKLPWVAGRVLDWLRLFWVSASGTESRSKDSVEIPPGGFGGLGIVGFIVFMFFKLD
jgi:hypothetical protein